MSPSNEISKSPYFSATWDPSGPLPGGKGATGTRRRGKAGAATSTSQPVVMSQGVEPAGWSPQVPPNPPVMDHDLGPRWSMEVPNYWFSNIFHQGCRALVGLWMVQDQSALRFQRYPLFDPYLFVAIWPQEFREPVFPWLLWFREPVFPWLLLHVVRILRSIWSRIHVAWLVR